MEFLETSLKDVIIFKPRIFEDSRGFFFESYKKNEYEDAGISYTFVQDNHSKSKQGTMRGLHYQLPHPQGKLVRVVFGEVFDVAVDIRRSSQTFGKWFGCILSQTNHEQIWIPPGFAHGFYTISDWAEVLYKSTDYYSPADEHTILWNDPDIGIEWPIKLQSELNLSPKDLQASRLSEAQVFE
jgi:dTDP-4-dehydrorhamnose 3,5-epimerase